MREKGSKREAVAGLEACYSKWCSKYKLLCEADFFVVNTTNWRVLRKKITTKETNGKSLLTSENTNSLIFFSETRLKSNSDILDETNWINPLLPNGTICSRIVKISFLKKLGIIEKISYERRDYETVDEKSLS